MVSIFFVLFILGIANAQTTYRVCSSESKSRECQALEKGASPVSCAKVTDSVDCLIKMEEDRADFGVVTAEEAIMAATNRPDRYDIIASVRNKEKPMQKYAFQSVVLVKKSHTGGLEGLKGGKLCHPGYGRSKEKLWSDRVLKYFENKVTNSIRKCNPDSQSSAEDDSYNLNSFFTAACRPGPWVMDPIEDKRLKEKFPTLCSLCTSNSSPNCDGYQYFEPRAIPGVSVNSHLSAIECLVSQKGTVAYVAYQHVTDYFKNNQSELNDYALLCEDGNTVPFTVGDSSQSQSQSNVAPCSWISQPWGAVLARKEKSNDLFTKIQQWMPSGRSTSNEAWIDSLDAIMFRDDENLFYPSTVLPLKEYIEGRPVPAIQIDQCHKALKWCTTNDEEQNKCSWVQSAATTVGLQPGVQCVQGVSYFDCLSMIKEERADFLSIDSNYGFLARKFYNVTAVVYLETSKTMSSKVLAIIKDTSKNDITRFENLKNKNACFPEYGGIGWVAFMRTAHERRVISSNECDYACEIVNFFQASCAPGAADPAHYPSKVADVKKLCDACTGFSPRNEQGLHNTFPSPPQVCPADLTNKFYGNKGALRCLMERDSHVAFIESQNLNEHAKNLSLNPETFRVLCRNGTLAKFTGFDVEDNCALSVTIDSEVVARRGFKDALSLQLFLQDIDTWFGYNSGSFRLLNLEVFSPFNGTKDLLFKDSTVGLTTSMSNNHLVLNYIELFKHTESCTGGAINLVIPSMLLVTLPIILQKLFS